MGLGPEAPRGSGRGVGVVWCGVLWGGYKRPVLVGGVESEVLGVTEKKPPASLSPAGLCWLVLK